MKTSNKLLFGALLLGSTMSVQAASITFDTDTYDAPNTIPLTTANWDTATPPPDPMNLPKWDPVAIAGTPLAVLTGIEILLRAQGEFEYKIENTDTTSGSTGTNELVVDVAFTLPCGACSTQIAVSSGTLNINLTSFDGSIDFGGTSGVDFGTIAGNTSQLLNINSANWGFYTGLGDFLIDVAATSDSLRDISGGDLLEQTTWRAGSSAAVKYTWRLNEAPVPGSLALLGLGALLLTGLRRKAAKS